MCSMSMVAHVVALTLLLAAPLAHAQFQIQESHSTASLRGIHAVNDSVAWATGTDGTILRTQDGGAHWQRCATPAGAETLDFRGVWAWSAQEAMILSSGPGDQSRVYKTTEGCAHWAETAKNTDKDGFWDALVFPPPGLARADTRTGVLIGDPLNSRFETRFLLPEQGWVVDKKSCSGPRRRRRIRRQQLNGFHLRSAALHHRQRRQRWAACSAFSLAGLQRRQQRLPRSRPPA